MSRFDSLEFEDGPRSRLRRRAASGLGTGTPIRDAVYFSQAGDEEFRTGRLESALKSYSRALECDSTAFPCWLMQVRVLIELGEYKEAGIWADKALEMFPEHPDLFAAKAVAAARMGLLDKAMAYSDNAASRQGMTPFVWLSRGEVLLARRSRMATHCFDQALVGCNGGDLRGWMELELARVLRRYGRFSEALYHASRAAQGLSHYAPVLLELGHCQASLGLPEAALSFEGALQLDRDCDEARRALARFEARGLWGSVRRAFRGLKGRRG